METLRRSITALLLAAGLTGSLAACGSADHQSKQAAAPSAGQPLLFDDEFNGPSGAAPDPRVWRAERGNAEADGWGNNELQYYTDAADNLALDGHGHLIITARRTRAGVSAPCWNGATCSYTSARITTEGRVALGTGHAEVRMKVPAGTGLWPAFWMLGGPSETWPAGGEIDVAEMIGSEPRRVNGTIHGPGYSDELGITGATTVHADLSAGFHTYAVDKSPDAVSWSLDGVTYFTAERRDIPAGKPWVFDHPFYLLLNLAVGGTMPGNPDGSTVFPASLVVDYVRLTGTGTGLSSASSTPAPRQPGHLSRARLSPCRRRRTSPRR